MSIYLRMNVGLYQGEIRGPFRLDAAKTLIERGHASPTESIGDGKFRVIETLTDEAPASEVQETVPVSNTSTAQQQQKKARR